MEKNQIKEAATSLLKAQGDVNPMIEPLTDQYGNFPISDAYEIQKEVLAQRLAQGRRVVGKKIGLTSEPMQKLIGVDQPDYGQVFDDQVFEDYSELSMSRMISPMVEAEIGMILKRDLQGPGVTALDVMNSCEAIFPVIEIIDSRIKDWKIKIQDTVADNAGCWGVVVGSILTNPSGIDLRLLGMNMTINGKIVATGAGAAVWQSPYRSVAWLANKLSEYEVSLKAGEIILSGALAAAVKIYAGDIVCVQFDRIGGVWVKFTP
ncbi:MAG: 2-keto-4-pentenoate hydratase [Firmicutes bacterium HGW-Firmicutes-12]|jgi:2-keto-4-pentenoate hydratase|nr:MAG: 2-keto-4-pentenoate hydratase [Firmicutes bacterium HGW-Firmicutes-12]